jgi:hypothetical protein
MVAAPVFALFLTLTGLDDSVAQKSRCALRATDSLYLSAGPVYRDCAVDRKARIKTRPTLIPPATIPDKQCVSAEFEFVVDTVGWPDQIHDP